MRGFFWRKKFEDLLYSGNEYMVEKHVEGRARAVLRFARSIGGLFFCKKNIGEKILWVFVRAGCKPAQPAGTTLKPAPEVHRKKCNHMPIYYNLISKPQILMSLPSLLRKK
jgi:hypothetical protein